MAETYPNAACEGKSGCRATHLLYLYALVAGCTAAQTSAGVSRPAIGYFGITNAASYYSAEGADRTVSGEIAPGSLFVIAGVNLGPAQAQMAHTPRPALELGGTSV